MRENDCEQELQFARRIQPFRPEVANEPTSFDRALASVLDEIESGQRLLNRSTWTAMDSFVCDGGRALGAAHQSTMRACSGAREIRP
jgi:hypothetical protein